MGEKTDKAKGWATAIIAVAGAVTAVATYLDGQVTKTGAKTELAANEVVWIEVIQRVSRLEAKDESRREHCSCIPKDPVASSEPPDEPETPDALEEPWPTEASRMPPKELIEHLRPKPKDPRVQRKMKEYDW